MSNVTPRKPSERMQGLSGAGQLLRHKADGRPMHYQLQQEIRRGIECGQWAPGSVIPPERKLAEEYGVSLGTVRTAILNLVSEGLLYRIQGKGTMVAGSKMIRESIRYYHFVGDFGRKEAIPKLKFLDLTVVEAVPEINRRLKLHPAEKHYLLRRLIFLSEKPSVYSCSYLPAGLFPGLDEFPRSRFEKVPLYLALEDHFGLPTLSNSDLISVAKANPETSALLKIKENSPILNVEMLAFTYRNRPYEYRISHCLTGDRKLLRNY
jgi:GntR family transcriptional regulator